MTMLYYALIKHKIRTYMSKITKYNVREHHSILRCFSHSTLIEKKVFMKIAHKLNSLKEKDYKNKDLLKLSIHVKELINVSVKTNHI